MDNLLEKELLVSGVAHDDNILKVSIFKVKDEPGVADKIFSTLADENINVDMIIQSGDKDARNDMSFTTVRDDKVIVEKVMTTLVKELDAEGFEIVDNLAKVSIVGAGMITNPGIAAKMFHTLAEENINIDMISTSEIKISCVIDENKIVDAVIAIHKAFGLDES